MSFSKEMGAQTQELKQFLRTNLYQHYRVHRMTLKAENVIKSLFDAFINDPKLLPPEAMQHCQELIADDSDEDMARGIADYIAGMTDRFAIIEFERVLNPRQLSIANLIP
jgi:dGTPase